MTMTTIIARPSTASRAAWLLAGVEFFFSLGWVVYVIFLPELLARGGVDRRHLPWLLAADQLLFALADWVIGVAVDRARAALRRIGAMLVVLAAVAAVAMLLLPWLAADPPLFLLATAVWVLASAALRAPPYVLLSRYAARSAMPRLAGIQLLGLALASALAPYLAIVLKGIDPALPFALSALAVGVTALALVAVERSLPPPQPVAADVDGGRTAQAVGWSVLLLIALLFAFGQQVHTAINSAAQFRRLADPALLPWLLPVFWAGFSIGLLAVDRLVRARGALAVLRGSAAGGALALGSAALAGSLVVLLPIQFIVGALWGGILCTSIGIAAERGDPLQSGRHTGALMATLAVAVMSRLSLAAAGGGTGALLEWLPVAVWVAALVLLLRLPRV
ncbi:MFS transporter [Accumulibacter sp.]|uniref:MFS transporter n=1 Tax=Accumulibacter sp. TaxID=2053492 RepID=UPI0025E588EA|nr:MFS transporter [Accumulibacter sp.]MCM8611448.1 MFS transporter [Accumulibacter sp.]MCM8635082.1 MFS transporter [Accumulibacter sp.]MCM8641005.1 MFS transporter [Accumulibacter sp.]